MTIFGAALMAARGGNNAMQAKAVQQLRAEDAERAVAILACLVRRGDGAVIQVAARRDALGEARVQTGCRALRHVLVRDEAQPLLAV